MPYIGKSPSVGLRTRYNYTATAGQTSFSGADNSNVTLTYTDTNYTDVYLNGTLLLAVTDYTSTTGTTIVLASAASLNDVLEVVVYDAFSVADTVSSVDGGTFKGNVNFTAATVHTNGITMPDSAIAKFGTDDDLTIQHTGTSAFIRNETGSLILRTDALRVLNDANSEQILHGDADGAVTLYFNNAIKIATKATGVTVTGEMAATTMDLSSNAVIDGTALVTGVLTTTAQVVQNGGFDSNDASSVIAADGEADNAYAMRVENLESTDDRSYGLYIQAGSTSTDHALEIVDHDAATNLFRLTGAGVLSVPVGIELGSGVDATAANILDDYEEGTWTPAAGSGLTVNGTYSSSGHYTKIGRMVYVKAFLTGATNVACSQNGQICTGLPFAPNVSGENVGISMDDGRVASRACSALSNSTVQNSSAIAATANGISFAITYLSN